MYRKATGWPHSRDARDTSRKQRSKDLLANSTLTA